MNNYCVMEYMYRDTNNFKAFGHILLLGNLTENFVTEIKLFLDYGKYFVAEQVEIPVLYSQLWEFSNGPTKADHAFHELSKFRPATDSEIKSTELWGTADNLFETFRSIRGEWDCTLSVHSEIF